MFPTIVQKQKILQSKKKAAGAWTRPQLVMLKKTAPHTLFLMSAQTGENMNIHKEI
jgi:hypothetical protein